MKSADIDRFRARLVACRDELVALSAASAQSRKPVELDQQSVGRLSRQDALQQQAMANAQEARRSLDLKKIEAALQRIEAGDFGYCEDCGEAIARRRLDIDPTARLCVDCAAG
ncbi:MAG: TraR/DksA family transcriptional regulator [Pseudomonadota bacterium]